MTCFGDCTFCGGEVAEERIECDYRRRGHLLVISNVPAGVCRQCGEKYFAPDVAKKMDQLYHDVFDHHRAPSECWRYLPYRSETLVRPLCPSRARRAARHGSTE